jgi:hypothetical protein
MLLFGMIMLLRRWKMKKSALSIILIVSVVALFTGFVIAQAPTKQTGADKQMDKGQPVVVKGKIAYMKSLGGYFLNGEDPAGEFIIVNQDPKLLGELSRSGQKVTINGRLRGADSLFIEKLDGKKYSGEKAANPRKTLPAS